MKNHAFRSLVIDLLDSEDGIPEITYHKLVKFADRNYPGMCDSIWAVTEGADGNNGFCIYLEQETANRLRKNQ